MEDFKEIDKKYDKQISSLLKEMQKIHQEMIKNSKNIEILGEKYEDLRKEFRELSYQRVDDFKKTELGKKYPHMLDYSLLYI